jgi:Zn-dependent M32 family carboxypeptidase
MDSLKRLPLTRLLDAVRGVMSEGSNGNVKSGQLYTLARDVVTIAVIPFSIWVTSTLWAHEVRMTARENNAWTAQDEAKANAEFSSTLANVVSDLHKQITALDNSSRARLDTVIDKLRDDIPPPEVRQRLDTIDKRLERIEGRIFNP